MDSNIKNKLKNKLVIKPTRYILMIFLIILFFSFIDWKIAAFGLLLFCIALLYIYKTEYNTKKEISKQIENMMFSIDNCTKSTLLTFPMPLAALKLDGNILWYNISFKQVFETEDLLEKKINIFLKEINIEDITKGQIKVFQKLEINKKYYDVYASIISYNNKNKKSDLIIIIYLIDYTELYELSKTYIDEKTSVGLIIIDNYDELMQSMEDSFRPQMLAEIDRKINNSLSFSKGIIKKFERDKYLFIFEYKYLKSLEDKKFDILDVVKDINIGNKIPVTLSLGFGVNGLSMIENFQNANASIDIALARGGDQVVLKNCESISFFGGKTRELEKRTKVKARVIAFALRELINESSQVIIMGHENCDIDSIGAALGIYRIAKNIGKDVYIVLNDVNSTIENVMAKIQKNPEYNNVFINKNDAFNQIEKKTLLIVVDTYRPSYTECPELLECTNKIVVIDHHRRGVENIQNTVLTYQETYASSACELVTEILQYVEEKIKLTEIEVETLYAGIVVDTKNFTFKTGVRTFEAAAFLRRQGVDTVSVKQIFQNDLYSYINISDIVKNAEIIEDKIAISECPENIKNTLGISAQAADQLLGLSGIIAAFVLSNINNEIFISGRSFGEVNVQVILEKLGGGGHLTVAGAQIKDVSMKDAKEMLRNIIKDYVKIENVEKE